MKVLVLSSAGKALDNRPLWYALAEHAEVDLHFLEKYQQRNLRGWFKSVRYESYDRIVLDLMFKHIHGQSRWLRSLPNLLLYEEDAYLDYMPGSKWRGAFSALYKKLPNVRVISTGAWVTNNLRAQRVDAHFVPKGFDAARLFDRKLPRRDIFLGFVGRLGSSAYAQRQELLMSLAAVEPIQLLRTKDPDEYPALLNRIRCFVSADIGLREYMAKNFEAMACGCLLIAKRQGDIEEQALGLRDGENILLYDDLPELREKVQWVLRNAQQALEVASAGRDWVNANNEYSCLARKVAEILERPFVCTGSVRGSWWKLW